MLFSFCEFPYRGINGIMDTIGEIQKALETHIGAVKPELRKRTETDTEFVGEILFFDPAHKDIGPQFIKQVLQFVFRCII